MPTQAQKQACIDEINRAYDIAEKHFGRTFTRVPVVWSNRMTSTAGYASWTRGSWTPSRIKLSSPIFDLNPEKFITDTPAHEAAHLIAVEMFGKEGVGHGRPWKMIMRLIGRDDARCHNMAVPQKNRFTYRATCGTVVKIGPGQHRKIQRGVVYTVRRTKGRILREGWVTDNTQQEQPRMASAARNKAPATGGKRQTKASIVRKKIAEAKSQGLTQGQVLANIEHVATAANLTPGLCKTYVRNMWDKA